MNDALVRIDCEIASLEARISALMYARKIVAGDRGTDPKNPEPPAGRLPSPGTKEDERSRQIAAILTAQGPTSAVVLARHMGIERSLVRRCLTDHPWFQKPTGKGHQPWHLTDAGRAANSPA